MKYGVVVFPGSNCDRDAQYILRDIMGQEVVFLWHKDTELQGVDAVVIPGGFSYGDYLRAGALACFSPIMGAIRDFVAQGGCVLGICNGFQVLCESGLLPGALRRNNGQRFVCRDVYLLPEVKLRWPTGGLLKDKALRIPIAHAEGCYYVDDETLGQMRIRNQILLRYCDADGRVRDAANPNGSVSNIAGICDPTGRIVGMMPHPERAADPAQGNSDGAMLLNSIHSSWFA